MEKLKKNIVLNLEGALEPNADIVIRSTDDTNIVVISVGSDKLAIELDLLEKAIEEVKKFNNTLE